MIPIRLGWFYHKLGAPISAVVNPSRKLPACKALCVRSCYSNVDRAICELYLEPLLTASADKASCEAQQVRHC